MNKHANKPPSESVTEREKRAKTNLEKQVKQKNKNKK